MLLNIVTPVSRPNNLAAVKESIVKAIGSLDSIAVCWVIVFDHHEPMSLASGDSSEKLNIWMLSTPSAGRSINGNIQRNLALEIIKCGWVYFLDDDTIMHIDLIRRWKEICTEKPMANLVFHQQFGNGSIRMIAPDSSSLAPCRVDSGQVVLRRETIGDLIWLPQRYDADGELIAHAYNREPSTFVFLNEILSIYNSLR